ncbi:response regulator transcription factor [Spirosoma agri]|uniref:Helix-turn-helix transcriptional regulator n=1 Tax=Spirosoma agri TaxID=1987381 RepID=A0A6M0IG36_9BACT|nr:helix-turn-helix transcriptional regulator [Spirosoma agri]NEU67134.1 helix-turn-helix transcriptional regulator [Spirosoma agri]
MKVDQYSNYRQYLKQLTENNQSSSWDFGMYVREAEQMTAFARQSSTLIFVLDYAKRHYPFIDVNTHQLLGHSNEAFYEGGLEYMLHYNRDFKTFNEDMYRDRATFLDKHRADDLSKYRFSMSYRIRGSKGEVRTVLQQTTIIHTTADNQPAGVLGFAWDISRQMDGRKLIQQIEQFSPEQQNWIVLVDKAYYPDIDKDQLLSKREIEILKWIIAGYTSQQIADKLYISLHTVRTHRKNMLYRTNTNNSMELRLFAENCGLL